MSDQQSIDDAPEAGTSAAAWRWGLFVTAFLVAQLGLAYAAVKAANSDGGAVAIPGAEAEIARSYDEIRAEEDPR